MDIRQLQGICEDVPRLDMRVTDPCCADNRDFQQNAPVILYLGFILTACIADVAQIRRKDVDFLPIL
jgi:hypothetical protein